MYKYTRINIQSGDIIFFQKKSITEKLIGWGTNSKYAHVAICISPELDLAIEAHGAGGVRAIDMRQIKHKMDIYRVKPVYIYDTEALLRFLIRNLNKKYDFKGVFYLGYLKTISKLGFKTKYKKNRIDRLNKYFCSELVDEGFNWAGLDLLSWNKDSAMISPEDIINSPKIEYLGNGIY